MLGKCVGGNSKTLQYIMTKVSTSEITDKMPLYSPVDMRL